MAKQNIDNEPMLEENSDELLLEETSDSEALLEEDSSESVLLEEDSETLLEEATDKAAVKAADEERYKAARERSRKEAEAERRRKAEEQTGKRKAEAEQQEKKRRAEEEKKMESSLREARRIAAEEERKDKQATQFLSLVGWGIGLPLILTFLMFIMDLIGLLPGDSISFLGYFGVFAFISILACFAIRKDYDLVRPQLYGIIGIMAVILVILVWRGCSGLMSGSNDDELKEKYDSVYVAGNDGLRIVSLNGKKGLIDKRGNEKLPLQYDEILEPEEKEMQTTEKNGDKEEKQTRIFVTRIVTLSGKKGLILTGEKCGDDFQQDVGVLFEPKHDSIYYDQENKYWASYDRDL